MDLDRYVLNKWETHFKFLNHSGSGVLTLGELMALPSQLLKDGKVELGTTLATAFKGHWDRVIRVASLNPDTYSIGQGDWVKGQMVVSQDKEYYAELVHVAAAIFIDMMDLNEDGVINIGEWRTYYKSQGMHDEEFIQTTFTKMDADGNGFIDSDEFVKALEAYNFTHVPGEDFSFLYEKK